jgi:hypothetical protein
LWAGLVVHLPLFRKGALVALTIRPVKTWVCGDRRNVLADITFDNSYPTGGEALTATDLGLTLELNAVHAAPATTGHVCPYDQANAKLMAFNGTTQIADRTDLSAVTTRVLAVGKGPGL